MLALTPEPQPGRGAGTAPRSADGEGFGADARPPRGSLRHPLTRVLLTLTFSTGLVDAASYLRLGHVFAANMTGNVVLLGFGVAGAGDLPVVGPIVSLVAFLLGAWVGARLRPQTTGGQAGALPAALALEAVMLLAATVVAAGLVVRGGALSGDAVIALLALGMGARNAAVRSLGVPDLTTTVLTMTLTALAAELPSLRSRGTGTSRRAAAVGSAVRRRAGRRAASDSQPGPCPGSRHRGGVAGARRLPDVGARGAPALTRLRAGGSGADRPALTRPSIGHGRNPRLSTSRPR